MRILGLIVASKPLFTRAGQWTFCYVQWGPTPSFWPPPQSEHKAIFDRVPTEDFRSTLTGQGD